MIRFINRLFHKKKRGFEILPEFKTLFDVRSYSAPSRKTHRAAGYDICSVEDVVIHPGEKVAISTGLTAHMEPDEFLAVVIRSGLAFEHNLTLQNAFGVIDADYYGNEIKILVRNEGKIPFMIKAGNRIAQGIFMPYLMATDDEASKKATRTGGFGSTGNAA